MANELQTITNGNNDEEKHYLVDDLKPEHQEAVYLKLEGAEYVYIARRLGFKYTYVRKIFSKGGVCHAAYEQLREELSRENRERVFKNCGP